MGKSPECTVFEVLASKDTCAEALGYEVMGLPFEDFAQKIVLAGGKPVSLPTGDARYKLTCGVVGCDKTPEVSTIGGESKLFFVVQGNYKDATICPGKPSVITTT